MIESLKEGMRIRLINPVYLFGFIKMPKGTEATLSLKYSHLDKGQQRFLVRFDEGLSYFIEESELACVEETIQSKANPIQAMASC